MALQEATEMYLVYFFFEDAIRLAFHENIVTLMPRDMQSISNLRGK